MKVTRPKKIFGILKLFKNGFTRLVVNTLHGNYDRGRSKSRIEFVAYVGTNIVIDYQDMGMYKFAGSCVSPSSILH